MQSPIDTFKDTHYREGTRFVNEAAEHVYVSHFFPLFFIFYICFTIIKHTKRFSSFQEEMVNIRTTQQSQTQQSQTHESTASSSSPHSAPPALMTERDINITVRGQRRGHIKGVGRMLTRLGSQAGASSAAPSTSSVRGPSSTHDQSTPIPDLVHQQVTELVQHYHDYMQAYVSQHVPGFQLPPISSMPRPPQGPAQDQPRDDDNTDGDDQGPTDLGSS